MEALELDTLVTIEAIASVSVMDLAMEALELDMDMDTKSMTLFLTTTTTPLLIATLEPDLIRQLASPLHSFKVIYPRLTRRLLSAYALKYH